jgi:hypothetical protein
MGDPTDPTVPAIICLNCGRRWPDLAAFWAEAETLADDSVTGSAPNPSSGSASGNPA